MASGGPCDRRSLRDLGLALGLPLLERELPGPGRAFSFCLRLLQATLSSFSPVTMAPRGAESLTWAAGLGEWVGRPCLGPPFQPSHHLSDGAGVQLEAGLLCRPPSSSGSSGLCPVG